MAQRAIRFQTNGKLFDTVIIRSERKLNTRKRLIDPNRRVVAPSSVYQNHCSSETIWLDILLRMHILLLCHIQNTFACRETTHCTNTLVFHICLVYVSSTGFAFNMNGYGVRTVNTNSDVPLHRIVGKSLPMNGKCEQREILVRTLFIELIFFWRNRDHFRKRDQHHDMW